MNHETLQAITETFTATNIFLAMAGLLISALIKLQSLKRKKKNFSFRFYIADNWMQMFASVLMVLVLLYFADSIAGGLLDVHIHEGSKFYELYALCAGYSNHQLFHDFMKSVKKQEKQA